jgi:hypothetical protein
MQVKKYDEDKKIYTLKAKFPQDDGKKEDVEAC